MDAVFCLALVIVLIIIVIACACALTAGKEEFRHRNRLWPTHLTGYYWNREAWPFYRQQRPPTWWWRRPGSAAPLELSLPLQNYYEYLYGFPPSARMPYNP